MADDVPKNLDAEKGVLGCMLISPEALKLAVERLGKNPNGAFFDPRNRDIYLAIVHLHRESAEVDTLTVTDVLRRRDQLEQVGGDGYLAELVTEVPTPAHIHSYIDVVERTDRDRGRLTVLSEVETAVLGGEPSPELVDRLIGAFEEKKTLTGLSFSELASAEIDPKATLLGDRFLCRGGGLLIPAPSGVGKSSLSAQQDILWSIGLPAFGIKPAFPLRILSIQAENDDGDMTEITKGVMDSQRLSEVQRRLVAQNTLVVSHKIHTGEEFLCRVVAPLLRSFKPDLLRLDPLNAFLGGDPANTEVVQIFLRQRLNPLLEKHGCGCVIVHHTPKTVNRDTTGWRGSDWMYAGAGSAEIINWARAVTVIDPTHDPRTFRFIAAKRGNRIGWTDYDGLPTTIKYFRHAAQGDAISWADATREEAAAASEKLGKAQTKNKNSGQFKGGHSPEDVLAVLPHDRLFRTNEALAICKEELGVSKPTFYRLWPKVQGFLRQEGGRDWRVVPSGEGVA